MVRAEGLGFGVWGFGFGVWGLGFRVSGLGFRVQGLGFRRGGQLTAVVLANILEDAVRNARASCA